MWDEEDGDESGGEMLPPVKETLLRRRVEGDDERWGRGKAAHRILVS